MNPSNGTRDVSRDGLYQKIQSLLGNAPTVTKLPELLLIPVPRSDDPTPQTVQAKKFGRELAMMELITAQGKTDSYSVLSQGSTNYSVISGAKAGTEYFLFIEQYRPTLTRKVGPVEIFADFPGGYNSEYQGVDLLTETLRELLEESGVQKNDVTDISMDTNYIDGIYTIRKGEVENTILFGRYTGEINLEPKLFGNKEEGERTVAVWYSRKEIAELLKNKRFGTPGVVSYAMVITAWADL